MELFSGSVALEPVRSITDNADISSHVPFGIIYAVYSGGIVLPTTAIVLQLNT